MSWSGTLPGTPAWIQTVGSGRASKLNNLGSTTSPFYPHDAYDSATQTIDYTDSPTVALKRLAGHSLSNPYKFAGQTFLVSAVPNSGSNTDTLTVYGGEDWGWDAYFVPTWKPPKKPSKIPAGVTVWTLNDVVMEGTFGTATATGSFETGSCGASCNSNIEVVENDTYTYNLSGPVNGAGWTVPSQIPEPCILGCAGEGPLYADLSLASELTPPESAADFGWEDAGEIFTGVSGTVTAEVGSGPTASLAFIPGAPELPAWALMLGGFAGLGIFGRRASRRARDVAPQ
jgi:hypothetical protein